MGLVINVGRPRERTGNKWRYSWEYHHKTELFLDLPLAEDQIVIEVDLRSARVDYE